MSSVLFKGDALVEGTIAGSIFSQKYLIKKRIGGGAFGDVYLAEELLNGVPIRRIALKILKADFVENNKLNEQFNDCTFPAIILDRATDEDSKKHFVQIYNWGIADEGGSKKAFIAMEYVAGSESLQKVIERSVKASYHIEADIVENYMIQLFTGLATAHQNNVIHSDLKPDNLLITNNTLKIVDFGLAQELSNRNAITSGNVGTILYMAPECLIGYQKCASDVYSTGLLLYELWTNYHPFEYLRLQTGSRSKDNSIIHYEARKRWRYIKGKDVDKEISASEKLDYILSKCLVFDIKDRYPSAVEVLEDINNFKPKLEKDYQEALELYNSGLWSECVNLFIKSNSKHLKKDNIKLDILFKLGLSLENMARTQEALAYFLETYELDEEMLILARDIEKRNNLLNEIVNCYERLGQNSMARIYRKKIGTSSGQGRRF